MSSAVCGPGPAFSPSRAVPPCREVWPDAQASHPCLGSSQGHWLGMSEGAEGPLGAGTGWEGWGKGGAGRSCWKPIYLQEAPWEARGLDFLTQPWRGNVLPALSVSTIFLPLPCFLPSPSPTVALPPLPPPPPPAFTLSLQPFTPLGLLPGCGHSHQSP